MSVNILTALHRYSKVDEFSLSNIYSSSNRINRTGEQLEYLIKDLMCGTLDVEGKEAKQEAYKKHLSYLGAKNHSPDFIIRQGDAFEVKKTRSKAGGIALNSSPPHQRLHSSNRRITDECRRCEDDVGGWDEKDFVYAISRVQSGNVDIDFTWFVYGDCYAADRGVYDGLSDALSEKVKEGAEEHPYGSANEESNELGRIQGVDPLGRTTHREREMWNIPHPANYFAEHIEDYEELIDTSSPMFAVMRKEKYQSFPVEDRNTVTNNPDIDVQEIDVPDPDNPPETVDGILLTVRNTYSQA